MALQNLLSLIFLFILEFHVWGGGSWKSESLEQMTTSMGVAWNMSNNDDDWRAPRNEDELPVGPTTNVDDKFTPMGWWKGGRYST